MQDPTPGTSTAPASGDGAGGAARAVASGVAADATASAPPTRRFWQTVRESLAGSEQDYTRGELSRAVVLLAVPMMLEMAGEALFAVCDGFMVARLGPRALATVGLTEATLEIVYAVAIGLGMATTALVARRYGEGDVRAAANVAVQTIVVGVAFSVLIAAIGIVAAPQILGLLGADAETIATGADYMRWVLGGSTAVVLIFLLNAVFRGVGDARTAMRALWLGNAINLALDPCLIFGLGPFPELGLTGGAIGTTIGRSAAVVYQLRCLARRNARVTVGRADLRIDLPVIRHLLGVSVGGIGQFLVASASWIGLVRILAQFGPVVMAGYVVAIRVVIFLLLPAWGLSNAASTLVGQNLGAGQPERAERSVWITGLYNMVFMGVIAIVFLFASKPVVAVMTTDPDVRPIAADCLRIIGYGYVAYAWGMVMLQAFNGAGDTTTPTIINIICFWLFQIPLAWALALPLGWGPSGVFWAIAISYSLSAVIGIVVFRRGRWKLKKV
jgi:putative MATE family efflux protein